MDKAPAPAYKVEACPRWKLNAPFAPFSKIWEPASVTTWPRTACATPPCALKLTVPPASTWPSRRPLFRARVRSMPDTSIVPVPARTMRWSSR